LFFEGFSSIHRAERGTVTEIALFVIVEPS
jgi:hypothetical protein